MYGIVKQSGGYVFADSELEKGTTFKVYLPQVDQPVESVSAAARKDGSVSSGLGRPCSSWKMNAPSEICCTTDCSRRATTCWLPPTEWKLCKSPSNMMGPIRLLITDVIMPQMSGPDLARRLTKVRSNIDVLYMSGYTDDKVGNISGSDGELTLIQKPFYIDDLVRKIQEMLRRKDKPFRR